MFQHVRRGMSVLWETREKRGRGKRAFFTWFIVPIVPVLPIVTLASSAHLQWRECPPRHRLQLNGNDAEKAVGTKNRNEERRAKKQPVMAFKDQRKQMQLRRPIYICIASVDA